MAKEKHLEPEINIPEANETQIANFMNDGSTARGVMPVVKTRPVANEKGEKEDVEYLEPQHSAIEVIAMTDDTILAMAGNTKLALSREWLEHLVGKF